MKKLLLLMIGLVLMTYLVFAEDCLYKQTETYQVEESRLYMNNDTLINETPSIVEVSPDISKGWLNIKMYNPLPMKITVEITYLRVSGWFGNAEQSGTLILKPNEYGSTSIAGFCSSGWNCIYQDMKYKIIEPDIFTFKHEKVSYLREICLKCGDKNCSNDGVSCQKNSECGGRYCVEGICSSSDSCYNNNCKCSSDKIQCDDNKRCTQRNIIQLDTKTICGKNEECVSGYLDPTSKLCAKSPSQIQKEKDEKNQKIMIGIIILSLIIVFGFGITLYLKNKNEKEKQKTEYAKQKTLQTQMEFVVTKLHTKNTELEKIKQEIQDIKIHKKIKEDELNRLDKLKEKESTLLTEIEDIEQQIDAKWENLKPFPDPQAKNRLVIINPYLGGYKCFYNNELELKEYPVSSLVHRWVWKKHNGFWPKLGYHIHHIDGDKYNNNSDNLEEINGEEHFEIHRQG